MLLSPNLSLDYIDVNAAQREVVHNAAVRSLDALVQLAVLDRDLATPPGSPSDGQRWIVAASPTGAWAGHAKHVAAWQDGAWHFFVPKTGWIAYIVDEGTLLTWNGSAWGDFFSTVTSIQDLALLGVGTTADATNPFSAKLNNTLWVAKTVAEGGDGNLRYKLSKESASKTLSLLLQTNFSGRAEIGLTGDDDFHFKVSSDGSTWIDAIKVTGASGAVAITSAAASAFAVGRQGSTSPALKIDASASSCVTGLGVTAAAAGSGLALAAISSGTDESITIDAKGAGTIKFGSVSTGAILFSRNANPTSSDGAALGTSSLMWSDLFLASGAVVNFNNGDVALTHSTDLLTLGGGDFSISNSTASTSTTTGALRVAGGVGIGGAVNVGTYIQVGGTNAQAVGVVRIKQASTSSQGLMIENSANDTNIFMGYRSDLGGCVISASFGSTGSYQPLLFRTSDAARMTLGVSGGLQMGAPTGGDKGAGTINAAGSIYVNNSALTCFGIEHLLDGKVRLAKWDGYSATGRHALAHEFDGLVVSGFDPRDPKQYIAKLTADRALPGMPSEASWRPNDHSIDELQMRQWLATELLCSAFVGSHNDHERRLAALESRIH